MLQKDLADQPVGERHQRDDGTGSWSIAIGRHHQHITGAVLELPTAVELACSRVAAAGLGQRITVITGDALAGELPAGYDVFLLANLIHSWSAEQNQEWRRSAAGWTTPDGASRSSTARRTAKPHHRPSGLSSGNRSGFRSRANCLGWIMPRLTVPWGR